MLFLTYFGISRFLVVFLLTPMGCMTLTYPQKVNIERYLANGEDIIQLSPAEIAKLLAELAKLFCLTVPEITEILSIVKIGFGVAEFLKIIYETACNGTHPVTEEQLLSMFEIIALRLEQIERRVVEIEDTLKTLVKDLPNLIRWEIAINTVESYTIPINALYRRFQYYQQHKGKIENDTLIGFAYGVVSDNPDSIQSYMADLHSLVSPKDHGTENISLRPEDEYEVLKESVSKPAATTDEVLSTNRSLERRKIRSLRGGIFSILEDILQDYDPCRSKQSSQQLIFGLYAMLSITQARGYAMVNFSYKILKHFNKGNFTIETKMSDENYDFYTNKLIEVGKSAISRSDNSFRNCDPSIYVEGENYVMITELLQGYIENQVDLNTQGTCTGVCSDFKQSKVEGCYVGETEYCGKHPTCHGQLYNCSFISYYSTVCPSSSPHRRLDWVKYSGLPVMGKQELNPTCPNQLEVDSWLRGFVYCKYCFCLCDDFGSPTSDRFVSLRPNFSNVTDGKEHDSSSEAEFYISRFKKANQWPKVKLTQIQFSGLMWNPL